MTLTTILRVTCAFAVLVVLQGICLAGQTATGSAAYVDGTVSAIPANTAGTLDLSDSEQLRFRYGHTSYAIPYDKITSFQRGRNNNRGFGSRIASGASKIGSTILPMFFSNKKYITIAFKSEDSANSEQMVFQVSDGVADTTIPVLEARTTNPAEAGQTTATAVSDEDSWWGNKVWRTNRNRHLWPPVPDKKSGKKDVEVAARE